MRKIFLLMGLTLTVLIVSGCGGGSSSSTTTDTTPTDTTSTDSTPADTTSTDSTPADTTSTDSTPADSTPSINGTWQSTCFENGAANTSLLRTFAAANDENIAEVNRSYSESVSCTGASSVTTNARVYVIGEKIGDTLYNFELTGTTAYRIDIAPTTLKIYYHGAHEPDIYTKI